MEDEQWQRGRIARTLALGLNDLEGSIATEETNSCDKNDLFLDDELLEKENKQEKGNDDIGSFFDCNVCLDLANDPIVTFCGHLFCWTCIYKWIHIHSVSRECPVCKGQVTLNDIIPIYGRGLSVTKHSVDDMNLKIPNRPQAKRVVEIARPVTQRSDRNPQIEESIRQRSDRNPQIEESIRQRSDLNPQIVESIRLLHANRRMNRSQIRPQNADAPIESREITNHAVNQLPRFRAIREELILEMAGRNVFNDSTQRSPAYSEAGESSRIPTVYRHRISSNLNSAVASSNMSTLSPADRHLQLLTFLQNQIEETYRERYQSALLNQIEEMYREGAQRATDDRDSMSSIAAVIQSDTTLENDSAVLYSSTSSSRRRNIQPRASASDVISVDSDSDSPPPTRRRMRP